MNIPSPQYIDLPIGRMAYRTSGDGPPLLLIHGWGGSSRHWLGAFGRLAEGRSIYAIDMPGYGESPPGVVGGGGLRGLAGAILAFIDVMGLGQIDLCGHSLGGAVALLTAAARPAQVDQLALVSFGIARSPEEEARARQIGAQIGAAAALWAPWLAMSRPWLAISRPWRQLTWTTPPLPALLAASLLHRIPDASTLALGAADLTSMDALTALESAASQGDLLVMQALGRAAMPALVLSGRQDPVFPPSSAAALSAALPNARTAVIDACGHVPMAEQPEACYDALDSFFIR